MYEIEQIDAVPVVAVRAPGSERALIKSVAPARQAMVAAGGFVAGAAIVGLAGRRRIRRSRAPIGRKRGARGNSGVGELVRIVGTRSLLVDIHLLDSASR